MERAVEHLLTAQVESSSDLAEESHGAMAEAPTAAVTATVSATAAAVVSAVEMVVSGVSAAEAVPLK